MEGEINLEETIRSVARSAASAVIFPDEQIVSVIK